MEINAEKTKLMTTSANAILKEIKIKIQKLETVTSFKDLKAIVLNWRFSQGQYKPLQLWQSCSQYGEMITYPLDQR